jgi:FixJ family two-component response regulator
MALLERPHGGFERIATGVVMKKKLVSVVEDDRFFRESMGRLMRSLGYTVEAFPSAADFLASPRLNETACLIADVHMPGMTGIELYRHLVGAGYAIPTILVTAYPNDIDQDRALNDGVVCYLRKPVDEQHLLRCLRAALTSGETLKENS